jgi:hypothetical protein
MANERPCSSGASANSRQHPTPQAVKDYIWQKLHPVRKLTTLHGRRKRHADQFILRIAKRRTTYYDSAGRRKRFAGVQE